MGTCTKNTQKNLKKNKEEKENILDCIEGGASKAFTLLLRG